MADRFDVVVVGGGPAGASAAREAALAGAHTLLLERAALPRYKTCGGGIVGLSAGALPVELRELTRDRVDQVTFTLAGRASFTRRSRSARPLFSLVFRSELDAALVAAAEAAGARVRTGVTVTDLAEHDGVVTVGTRSGPVEARVVVGADGTGGRAGGWVGVRCPQVDVGLEAEIPVSAAQAARWRHRVLIDWGPVAGSYGWVFPKGDVLTVGVIGARSQGEAVRRYYRQFLEQLGLDASAATHDSGHLTRCRAPDSPLRRGNVLVAGDAAGLLEPWTREGISFALRSGVLVGRAAARGQLAGYPEQVEAVLGGEMAAGARFLAAFRRHPEAFHAALIGWPGGFGMFCNFTRGDTTLAAELRRRRVSYVLNRAAGRPDPAR